MSPSLLLLLFWNNQGPKKTENFEGGNAFILKNMEAKVQKHFIFCTVAQFSNFTDLLKTSEASSHYKTSIFTNFY